MPQPPQSLGLNLSDPLSSDIESAADLFERVFRSVIHAETHPKDLFLSRAQSLQDSLRLVAQVRQHDGLDRRSRPPILEEVAEVRIPILADRALQRDCVLRGLED